MMASSPIMNPNTTSDGDHEFAELRHLLTCHNAACGTKNPRMRCSRCQSVYYCSVACQRVHWKKSHQKTCQPIETKRSRWLAHFDVPACRDAEVAFGSKHGGKSAEVKTCGICLEDTIINPIVLPKCAHVFCFTCLGKHQGHHELRNQAGKSCPNCRAPIERHVTEEELDKVALLLKRASFLTEANEAEERDSLRRLAQKKMDMVFEVDPCNTAALLARAILLTHAQPLVAVKILQLLLSLAGCETSPQYFEKCVLAAINTSNDDEALIRTWYRFTKDRTFEGIGIIRCNIHLYAADALEVAGLYDLSQLEYMQVVAAVATAPSGREDGDILTKAHLGLARTANHLGKYQMAIDRASVLLLPRKTSGAHKLVAETLLAMAEHPKTSGETVTAATVPCTYSATLAGAIEVMYKGFVYENQWDDKYKQVNRAFLQELLDKQRALQELVDQTAAIHLTE